MAYNTNSLLWLAQSNPASDVRREWPVSESDRAHWAAWVRQLADGDEQVTTDYWNLFGSRIRALADNNLTGNLHRRVEPDDIANSACRTFLRRAKAGQFALPDSESLWRLMCTITLAKTSAYARYHLAQKRGIQRESSTQAGSGALSRPVVESLASKTPSPEEIVDFQDQFLHLMNSFDAESQQIVHLKLEQHTNAHIAEQMGCAERTVRRKIKQVQATLEDSVKQAVA